MFFEFLTPMRRPGLTSRVNLVEIALNKPSATSLGTASETVRVSNFTSLDSASTVPSSVASLRIVDETRENNHADEDAILADLLVGSALGCIHQHSIVQLTTKQNRPEFSPDTRVLVRRFYPGSFRRR